MYALTTAEINSVRETVNAMRKKRGAEPICMKDALDLLGGLHAAGLVVIKRGVLLQFESYCQKVGHTIKRYRKAGLL